MPETAEFSPFVEVGVFMPILSPYCCMPAIKGVFCRRMPPVGVSCCEAKSFYLLAITGSAKSKPIFGDVSFIIFY